MIITLRKKQADFTLESYSIINSKHNLSVPFLIKLKKELRRKFFDSFHTVDLLCQVSLQRF